MLKKALLGGPMRFAGTVGKTDLTIKETPALRAAIDRLAAQGEIKRRRAELDELIRTQPVFVQRKLNRTARWMKNAVRDGKVSGPPPRHIKHGILLGARVSELKRREAGK